MIISALLGNKLPIYGNGLQVRDWIFVEDHVDALLKISQKGKIGETYNVGGNNQTSPKLTFPNAVFTAFTSWFVVPKINSAAIFSVK